MLFFIRRWNQNLFIGKRLRNFGHTGTVCGHLKNLTNNGSGFFVHIESLLITGNPFVPVGDTAAAPLAVLHPGFEHRTNFVAGVFGVPLVHNVQKGRKVVVCWIGTVYIIIDGNEPNTF